MNFRRAVDCLFRYIAITVVLVALLALRVEARAAGAGTAWQPGRSAWVEAYPPPANPPVAADDSYSTNEDTVLNLAAPGVLANDTVGGGSPLTAVMVNGAAHGLLVLRADGSFKFTPDPNWNGTDSFTYKASNGSQVSNAATVAITVEPVNDAPIAVNDSYATPLGIELSVDLPGILGNDIDVDGNPLSVVLVKCPQHYLTYSLGVDGSLSYVPEPGFTGIDSLTYFATDYALDSNVATVTLAVGVANKPPEAKPDGYSVDENSVLTVGPAEGVLKNDTDVDKDPLNATRISGPSRGGLVFNADGSFTYTPYAGWNGDDSFTYQTDDGAQYSNVATVTINVKPVDAPPEAINDNYTTAQDTQLVITPPGVLGNDTDAENDPLTAVKVTDPGQGALVFNADGSFTYTPVMGFAGTDTFTYKASDGKKDSNPATVTITVKPPNRAPIVLGDSYSTDEDTPLIIPAPGVLANDTDPDGDPLTVDKVSNPANGTLVLNPDGSFTYTPDANWYSSDTFTYKATDGVIDSSTVTVTITVNAINDAPIATDDSYSTHYETELTVAAPGVLSNDTDADSDPLTAIQVSGPSHGALALNADGAFTYTPDAGFSGDDAFQYKTSDTVLESNAVTVTIQVHPPNIPPVASDDSYSVDEDKPLNITSATGVLSNDNDPDGSSLTVVKLSDPANGVLALNADGSFVYTPKVNWYGTDSFTYQAFDEIDHSGPAMVTITVNPVNDAPVAVDDTYAMTSRGKLIIIAPGVLSNDTDVEGSPLSAVKQSEPAHGKVTLNADGSFTYVPNGGYRGTDTFTYKVNDGTADSNIVTVTITGIDEIYIIYLPRVARGNK